MGRHTFFSYLITLTFAKIVSKMNGFFNWIAWVAVQPWFSPIVSALTIPILAWTAWEALKTSKATSDANNLKLLPLLGIYFYRRRDGDEYFKIKNLGEGVAYNIKIDPWTLIMQDTQEIIDFKMSMPGTNILTKDEEKEIDTEVYINGAKSTMSSGMIIAYLRGLNTTGIQIQFKDATGRKCACLINISEKKVHILKPTYRLNFYSMINIWYGLKIQRFLKLELERFFWRFEKRKIGKVPKFRERLFNIVKGNFKKV